MNQSGDVRIDNPAPDRKALLDALVEVVVANPGSVVLLRARTALGLEHLTDAASLLTEAFHAHGVTFVLLPPDVTAEVKPGEDT